VELTEKSREENYVIRGKLSEKDEEIGSMKEELTSMRSQMNDVLEVLKIAKSKDGMLAKDRTMLDENRRVTFGYVENNNQIVEVKIPPPPNLSNANLSCASLFNAKLFCANLSGANLSGANLSNIKTDNRTNFENAILTSVYPPSIVTDITTRFLGRQCKIIISTYRTIDS